MKKCNIPKFFYFIGQLKYVKLYFITIHFIILFKSLICNNISKYEIDSNPYLTNNIKIENDLNSAKFRSIENTISNSNANKLSKYTNNNINTDDNKKLINKNLYNKLKNNIQKNFNKTDNDNNNTYNLNNKNIDTVNFLVNKYKNKKNCLKPIDIKKYIVYFPIKEENNSYLSLGSINYKNLVFDENGLSVFKSSNSNSYENDRFFDYKGNYIIKYQYNQIHTPCLNRSYVCSYKEFKLENFPFYPEIDYSIPEKIIKYFVNKEKAINNCLLLLIDPILSMSQALWICHDNLLEVILLQEKLSNIYIYKSNDNYDFFIHYVKDQSTLYPGVLEVQYNKIQFYGLNKKKLIEIPFDSIEPYVISMYMKDKLPWKSNFQDKPEDGRCIRINVIINKNNSEYSNYNESNNLTTENLKKITEYFCVIYGRNDLNMKRYLNVIESRWAAEMYANKINKKMQEILLIKSFNKLNKYNKTDSNNNLINNVSIENSIIIPLKNELLNKFYFEKYKLNTKYRLGTINSIVYQQSLVNTKSKVITEVCKGIDYCIKILNSQIDNGEIVLNLHKNRFSIDNQNPYQSLLPKTYIKLNNSNASELGKKLVDMISNPLSDYKNIIETIDNIIIEETPNYESIIKSVILFKFLRQQNKRINSIEELGYNCKFNSRIGSNNIKKKLYILLNFGERDPFLDSFKSIGKE